MNVGQGICPGLATPSSPAFVMRSPKVTGGALLRVGDRIY